MASEFRYRTDMDVASIFFVWRLELGSKEDIKWVMHEYIKEEWKFGKASFMAMAHLGVGFITKSKEWLHVVEFDPPPRLSDMGC
ncbi:hypothetical protein SUGI_0300180 [Cryptomeria japonica]|nr:hypothetical protein SUGI_0300180 [Cryptomeria japonica]